MEDYKKYGKQQDGYSRFVSIVALVSVMGMAVYVGTKLSAPAAASCKAIMAGFDCRFCHLPPVAKNLKEYDARRDRTKIKTVDLTELTR